MTKKTVGIIGATGYTGSELVRILQHHPEVEIELITSERQAGKRFSDIHPALKNIADHELVTMDALDNVDPDLIFLALPHGVSMKVVKRFWKRSFNIIDLSGDFRLSSPQVYESWYGQTHHFQDGFEPAVFGLPELYPEAIRRARLVANPGCYPTSAILGIVPLLANNLIDPDKIIIDSKSGVTGAGANPKAVNQFSNVNDNFKAYGLKNHRHTIEIQETLERWTDRETTVQFTPHLLPVDRGILSTMYVQPKTNVDDDLLRQTYADFYAQAPFVRLREESPSLKQVRGSNYCDIHAVYDARTDTILIVSAIDNLVKGAAGQAVQNMNLMFGWDETTGLQHLPLKP